MGGRTALVLMAVPLIAAGQDQIAAVKARLAEEADAFRRLGTQVLGEERLHQRAQKPSPRFRPRVGNAAKVPPPVVWQERQIVSEYSFGRVQNELHELRSVVSVDGRKVSDPAKAADALSKAVNDDARKKQLLKDFEKYGLVGAATDFGQVLLLFTPRDIGNYEFTFKGSEVLGATPVLVFGFEQKEGREALTVIQANRGDQANRMRIRGEVRVEAAKFVPMQITISTSSGEGPAQVREEAAVSYKMSPYGALLPSATDHRELRNGKLVAENNFLYSEFRKFGASSDIKFEVGK